MDDLTILGLVSVILFFYGLVLHLVWIGYAFGWNPPPWITQFMFGIFMWPRWCITIILLVEIVFVVLLFSGALRDLPNPFPEGAQ